MLQLLFIVHLFSKIDTRRRYYDIIFFALEKQAPALSRDFFFLTSDVRPPALARSFVPLYVVSILSAVLPKSSCSFEEAAGENTRKEIRRFSSNIYYTCIRFPSKIKLRRVVRVRATTTLTPSRFKPGTVVQTSWLP